LTRSRNTTERESGAFTSKQRSLKAGLWRLANQGWGNLAWAASEREWAVTEREWAVTEQLPEWGECLVQVAWECREVVSLGEASRIPADQAPQAVRCSFVGNLDKELASDSVGLGTMGTMVPAYQESDSPDLDLVESVLEVQVEPWEMPDMAHPLTWVVTEQLQAWVDTGPRLAWEVMGQLRVWEAMVELLAWVGSQGPAEQPVWAGQPSILRTFGSTGALLLSLHACTTSELVTQRALWSPHMKVVTTSWSSSRLR
jgi:hypothetical protein